MSENKLKYFTVTSTSIVKANNKADAEKIAVSNRKPANVEGKLIFKDMEIERISAAEAREFAL